MSLKKGTLKSFDAVSYTATVQVTGSHIAYLERISVARNIAGTEMVAGRKVAIAFFSENNPREAVVIGVYT